MTCEEITMESGIPESIFHHVLTEVLKRKVTAFSMTMQDIISHKLYRMFSPITSGKQCLTLVAVLISVLISNSSQS
jgi:hypothetical protein